MVEEYKKFDKISNFLNNIKHINTLYSCKELNIIKDDLYEEDVLIINNKRYENIKLIFFDKDTLFLYDVSRNKVESLFRSCIKTFTLERFPTTFFIIE